jgi:hypothetical protein
VAARPDGYATLVAGGSVSPLPTSSPQVVCIRAVIAALRTVVEHGVPPRRAAAGLAEDYGGDGVVVRVFSAQLPTYRHYAADRGGDVAGTLVWPALEAACS